MHRLLIFLREPTPGRVKTRLASSIGSEAAADIYRLCVELTLQRLASWRTETVLYVDPPEALERVQAWIGQGWSVRPQRGATLGERLSQATAEVFAEGARRIVVIGTDSPWLAHGEIEEAFRALAASELTVGPAADGGYYLIGLSRPMPWLFDGIAWSTASVYQATMAKARSHGVRIHTLHLGYDIDRVEDLRRFVKERATVGG